MQRIHARLLLLLLFTAGSLELTAATFTWTGAVSGDWFNQNNWNPVGVPATNDTVNFASGTINLTAPVIINGQFNWSGGALEGSGFTVTVNGSLNISGSTAKTLANTLTNAGTVTWTGAGNVTFWNDHSTYHGGVYNLAGAVFNIETDQSINCACYGNEFFINQGTFEKTVTTGTTYLGIAVTNSGTVEALTGALNFNSGGSVGGVYSAAAGASVNFTSGNFYVGAATVTGAGVVAQLGGTLTLLSSAVTNLQLTAGTLVLAPGFEGGTITNLTIAGATLSGTNIVTGTLNWHAGIVSSPLTVANGGTLNISGNGAKTLENTLTNMGMVTWTGGSIAAVDDNVPTLRGSIWNLAGATFNIATDQNINCACYGYEFFNNAGLLEKTAGTGTTYIGVLVTNSGTVEALEGTLVLNNGGSVGGVFSASSGAAIDFGSGNFYVGAPTINGPGSVAQTGGRLTLLDDTVANLQLDGGQLVLAPGFQGGTITNLTMEGVTLTGTNTVTGTLNWLAGIVSGPLTVANTGTLDISGNAGKTLYNTLTNLGMVAWTGSGAIALANNNSSSLRGAIWNMPGATFNIATDQNINCACYGNEFFNNAGLLEKTAGTGITYIGVEMTNSGTIEGLDGTLNLNNGGSLGGVISAAAGASVNFTSGNFYVGAPTIAGAGTVSQAGGSLTLLADAVANLQLDSGQLALGPSFQGGVITNLTIAGATLTGTNKVTGTLNWLAGNVSGPLTVANTGMLNISGNGAKTLYNALTNAGTITWTGNGGITVANNNSGNLRGSIWNLAGAVFNIATDENINCACYGNEFFVNQGTLEKTAGTGTTYIGILTTNSGTVEALAGTLNFNSGGVLGGTYMAASGAAINFTSGSFYAGAMTVTGAGTVSQTGGMLTLTGDIIPNLQLTGGTLDLGPSFQGGTITNLTLTGITLSGTNRVTGTLNWVSGAITGPVTVASGGALNFSGSGAKALESPLTNAGTITWTGTGAIAVYNNNGSYRGAIWNLAGAVFNIATDENLNCGCYGNEFFINQGTLEKTAGAGTTYIGVMTTNSGTVEALAGTLNFNDGGALGGIYTAASGAAINFTSGNFYAGAMTVTGAGTVSETGGTLTLTGDVIPNLQLTGGSLVLGPTFQGGTITNLTISGVALTGTNRITGTMNWIAGTILGGPLTVASGGELNLSGNGTKVLESALTNVGTITWTGTGGILMYNNNGSYRGAIWNLAGAVFNIATDENISCGCYGDEFFNNEGTLEKTAGTGTTYIGVMTTNGGTVEAVAGTLNFNNGGALGGIYSAASGAAIYFTGGNFTVGAPVVSGPGPVQLIGGTMTLLGDMVPNLDLVGGTLLIGPSFQGGTITNLTIAGSTLGGTNVVGGRLTWTAGILGGPLTVASNAALVISGSSTKVLENALMNFGVVTWTGTGNLYVYNNNNSSLAGVIENEAGGLFQIQNDQALVCGCYGYESFLNQGTVEKSIATNTSTISIPFTNAGALSVDGGLISFSGNPAYAQAGASLDFGIGGSNNFGRASMSGKVNFDGSLGVHLFNGYTPKIGDTFPLVNYNSFGGSFASLNLPAMSSGQEWELDYGAAGVALRVVTTPAIDSLAISGSVTDTNGKAIVGATVYAFVPGSSFTNAVTNGSFEMPSNNGPSYIVYNPGSTAIPGWSVFGAAVDIAGPNLGQAEDGAQFFDPTGNASGMGGGIAQTFPTTVGVTYKLGFFLGYASNPGQVSLGVTIAGISNAYMAVNSGLGGLNWTPQGIYYTAVSNQTTVTFQALTTYNSDNSFVDNVQVTPPDYGRVRSAVTDGSGHYQIAVANGRFQVGVSGLPALGFDEVAEQTAVVTTGNQSVNFTAQPLSGAQLFSITTGVNPAGAGAATGGGTYAEGTLATVNATPNTSSLPYLFANWTENGVFQSASNSYSFTVNHDRQLVANFTLPLYSITASNNPTNGGVISGTGSYYYGTTSVLTAYPSFGFKFTNWTEGASVVGSSTTLSTTVFTNHNFVANYLAANLIHVVSVVSSPGGVASVTGAGTYTNGQTVSFTTPMAVTNSPYYYTFARFTLSNTVVSTSTNFTKTFSTLDATNLTYVAVYNTQTILPLLTNVTANYVNPVPATTNFQLALEFDRSMNTNVPPVVVLTNSAVTPQPVVKTNGVWTTTVLNNDTYHTPPITFSPGMDGTMQLIVSGAEDLNGDFIVLTNPVSFTVEATPPPTPVLSVTASNSSSVTVSWNSYAAPADLGSFRIYIETTNYNTLIGVPIYTATGPTARSYPFYGLALNTNYYIAVQAVDTAGNALTAVTPLVVNLPSALPPPVPIVVTALGATSATVSWSSYNTAELLGLAGFQVYYQQTDFSTVTSLTPQATVGPSQTSLQVNGLDRTKTNYFAVVAFNNTNGFNPHVTTASWSDPYAGNIGAATSIGGAGQVVNIYHSITVVSNATLTVQPGTTLMFAPGTSLTVQQGALTANGTALAPIIFDSANDTPGQTPAPGDWGGVTLASGAGGSSLQFVEILYGAGLTLNGCSPNVQAFTATGNAPWGLGLNNGATLTTSAALLAQNGVGAEQTGNALLTIQNSVLQNNNTNGWGAGSLQMNASSDWWGTPDPAGIAALVSGDVSYNQYLTYEPLLTPAIGASNGVTQVGTTSVGLDLACRTAVSMRLSEDFSFSGVFFSPFTNQIVFPLSAGGGIKHIFAQFRSVTGQTNTPLELDVNYITAGPVIQYFSLADGQTLNRPITLTASATATLGMKDLELYVDGVGWATNAGGSFSYYFDIRTLSDAIHQVVLLARDTAGHIATLEAGVIIAITPPPAPVIVIPPYDYVTNNAGFAVSGTAEAGISIQLTANGQVLGTTQAAANGSFSFANLTLPEGVNTVVAAASDSTGTTTSNPRHITVETIPPAALVMNQPVYTPGTGLAVSWKYAATGKQAATFQLFWGTTSFSTTNQATSHSILLPVMSDTLQGLAAGTYYFGVVGFDAAGNASPLSALVSSVYDATAPTLGITYAKPSPVGLGPLGVTLTASKALAATPSLTIQPSGAGPVLLSLTNVALNTWQSTLVVSSATPSGPATAQAAAQDQVGNVFNGAPAGAALMIDTTPPTGTIVTAPPTPVQTVSDTNITVSLTLSKLAQAGTTPTLVFMAPIGSKTPITLSGAGSNWNGSVTLTSAMGSGFGKFLFTAVDAVGNIGSNIVAGGYLELYNTALPSAPPDPTGLSAVSLPGGYIRLTWNSVSNAQIYRLYRETGKTFTPPGTLDLDNLTSTTVTDLPPTDGFYGYAVSASRFGSESGVAVAFIALSDRTPPPAPTNVAVALAASGLQVTWQQSPGEVPDHFNVYRNGTLIGVTPSVAPVVDYPPKGTNVYVVDSSDLVGNQNPSLPVTNILLVAPVVSLSVVVSQGQAPSLTWVSTDVSATGFNIYRNGVRQNVGPLAGTNYIDSLPLSDAVTYAVTAVNALSQESPPRLVNVYPLGLGLQINPPTQQILINYFDQYQAGITNLSSAAAFPLAQLTVSRSINGVTPLSVTQSDPVMITAGAVVQQTLIVPEAPVAATQTAQLTVAAQTDNGGSTVIYKTSQTFTNFATPGLEIAVSANQLPLAGGLNSFLAQIQNPSSTPIDIVTSRNDDGQPGDLYISVRNSLGQEVSRTPYQAVPPGTVFLADGRGYSQISAGSALNLTISNVLVPAALAGSTNTTFVAVVSNIYAQIGAANEAVSGPLVGSMTSSSLAVPPYYGTALTDKTFYTNSEPIVISGQAISYSTGLPVPGTALNIGFATRGYHWDQAVTTDGSGNYQYVYDPPPGFAGTLSIWAANPLVVDQLNQASVVVYRAYISPATGEVEMSKNSTVSFNVQLINPGDVPLTGFTVSCAAYQVSGATLTPITSLTGTSLSAPNFGVPANSSQTVTLQLAADINAPSSAEAVFSLTSAEGAVATLTTIVTLLPATPAISVVSPAVGYVEANVNRGEQKSAQVTFVNQGLTALRGVTITPPTNVTWMQVNLPVSANGQIQLPDLPEGQSNTFTVVFTPPTNTALAQFQDDLIISGTNLATPYHLNLYAIVTSDLTGNVQFQVEDFLASYLSGATVRLQNNLLQASAGPFSTDTNGIVTITNLEEGVWNWQVSAPGCSAASGTVTILADQTVYQNPILSRSLVTINFTVVPVPFTDEYEITVEQTFSTFVPVPVLVLSPPYTSFNNVTPGFQASLNISLQNAGLIQITDVNITGQEDDRATLTPLITYLPALLPQQTVQIPFTATYSGTNAPGHEGLGSTLAGCLPYNSDLNNLLGAFLDGLAALASGNGLCPINSTLLLVLGSAAVGYSVALAAAGAVDIIAAPLSAAASFAGCLIGTLLSGGGGGGGGGGAALADGNTILPNGDGCLAPTTLVLMADGSSKPICQVLTNDVVRTGPKPENIATVIGVYEWDTRRVEEIDLTGSPASIVATSEHFFWVDGQGWTAVSRLQPGDWLFNDADRRVRIAGIKTIDGPMRVYTLKLTGDVAFYANAILTHELCGSPPEAAFIRTSATEVAK